MLWQASALSFRRSACPHTPFTPLKRALPCKMAYLLLSLAHFQEDCGGRPIRLRCCHMIDAGNGWDTYIYLHHSRRHRRRRQDSVNIVYAFDEPDGSVAESIIALDNNFGRRTHHHRQETTPRQGVFYHYHHHFHEEGPSPAHTWPDPPHRNRPPDQEQRRDRSPSPPCQRQSPEPASPPPQDPAPRARSRRRVLVPITNSHWGAEVTRNRC